MLLLIEHSASFIYNVCRIFFINYRPQTKLRKGNVFTSVCKEFCPKKGVCIPAGTGADTPSANTPRQTPPRQAPPWADTPSGQTPPWANTPLWADISPKQTATAAEGTHPTGMHSCSVNSLRTTQRWRARSLRGTFGGRHVPGSGGYR